MSTRTIATLLIALALTACGASPGNGVNPQGFQQWYDDHTLCPSVNYSSLNWSSDGSRLYYGWSVSSVPGSEISVIDIDNFEHEMVFKDASGLLFSPDGTMILFQQRGAISDYSYYHVYTVSEKTASLIIGQANQASWSPDSQWIVVEIAPYLNPYLVKVNVISGEVFPLNNTYAYYWRPLWSPDGKMIAFSASDDGSGLSSVFVMNEDGSEIRQMTDADSVQCGGYSNHRLVGWLPDGDTLAFERACGDSITIGLVSTSGVDLGDWGDPGEKRFWPVWSPDGKSALYQVMDNNANSSVNISDADGLNGRVLMQGAYSGVWSPDSQQVALLVTDSNNIIDIWVINADGTNARRITNNPGSQHTCWH